MLQDGVPAVYRKPSHRVERGERRANRISTGLNPENGGGSGDYRGLPEVEAMGKEKDSAASSLTFGGRTSASAPKAFNLKMVAPSLGGGGDATYRFVYLCACAVAFVNAMTFSVLGPFLPAYISARFGGTASQVGMIMAAYPAMNLACSPLVGWVTHRYGRWPTMFAGLVLLAVATALYGLSPSVWWLYVASGLHGAALSFIHVSSLGLLSSFPDRITESMAGIEVWSGVASILGPPIGGLVVPYGGVSSIFLLVAVFPVTLVLLSPRIAYVVRSMKAEGDCGEKKSQTVGGGGGWSLLKVARSRGVLAGAFVTAYNNGVIGFLEVTLAPHLAQTLSTSPRSIGFVLVLPNVLYTVTAMKAEDIVHRVGVRRTLLSGLCIMSLSLVMYGPSPALAPALMTRGAARGAIGTGLLAFEIGSALASVPAFTAMQGGVAGMGPGADDMVASAHAMAIGVGEVIGPMVGGFIIELLPKSNAFACEPNAPIMPLHDPVFQLAGELRPHHKHEIRQDRQEEKQEGEEGRPEPREVDVGGGGGGAGYASLVGSEREPEGPGGELLGAVGARAKKIVQGGGGGGSGGSGGGGESDKGGGKGGQVGLDVIQGQEVGVWGEEGDGHRLPGAEGVPKEGGGDGVAFGMGQGGGEGGQDENGDARGLLDVGGEREVMWPVADKGEEERQQQEETESTRRIRGEGGRYEHFARKEKKTYRASRNTVPADDALRGDFDRGEAAAAAAAVAARNSEVEREGEHQHQQQEQQQQAQQHLHQRHRLLRRGFRKRHDNQPKRSAYLEGVGSPAGDDIAGVAEVRKYPPAGGAVDAVAAGVLDLAPGQAATPSESEHREAVDLSPGGRGDGAAAAAAGADAGGAEGAEDDAAAGVHDASYTSGLSESGQAVQAAGKGGGGGGGEGSCESSFPLATTLLAWASGLAVVTLFRLLPSQPGTGKGHGAGQPS